MSDNKAEIEVMVSEIKEGDEFRSGGGWVAIKDAVPNPAGGTVLRVQYNEDGGFGARAWDDSSHKLKVWR